MPLSHESTTTPAAKICPRCGPTPRRCDTLTAVGLVGILVGIMAGVGQAFLSRGTGPHPAGLYIAAVGAAVAALWLIARAFGGRHC
jgi:hypothetical protein